MNGLSLFGQEKVDNEHFKNVYVHTRLVLQCRANIQVKNKIETMVATLVIVLNCSIDS